MIYASAVLHNFCTVHTHDSPDAHADMTAACWDTFFTKYKATQCPTCKRRNVPHCVHQAAWGITGGQPQAAARRAPSHVRDQLREQLWQEATGVDPEDETDEARVVRAIMDARAGSAENAYTMCVP